MSSKYKPELDKEVNYNYIVTIDMPITEREIKVLNFLTDDWVLLNDVIVEGINHYSVRLILRKLEMRELAEKSENLPRMWRKK